MKQHKGSFSMLLWAIIIAGLAVLVALVIGYWLMHRIPPASRNISSAANFSQSTGSTLKSYNSLLGYSFNFSPVLTGGKQNLTDDLKKAGVEESVILQTPKDAKDRLAILVSVERHPDIVEQYPDIENGKGLTAFADAYEEGSRAAGISLVREGENKFSIDHVGVLERLYNMQGKGTTKNVVLFAQVGSRFYVFSFLRSSDNEMLQSMEKLTLNSLRFLSQ